MWSILIGALIGSGWAFLAWHSKAMAFPLTATGGGWSDGMAELVHLVSRNFHGGIGWDITAGILGLIASGLVLLGAAQTIRTRQGRAAAVIVTLVIAGFGAAAGDAGESVAVLLMSFALVATLIPKNSPVANAAGALLVTSIGLMWVANVWAGNTRGHDAELAHLGGSGSLWHALAVVVSIGAVAAAGVALFRPAKTPAVEES